MAAILASHGCCCRTGEVINRRRRGDYLSYSECDYDALFKHRKLPRFKIGMQQQDLPAKLSRHGKVIKMVPTTEIRKLMLPSSTSTSETVNGSAKNVNGISMVNGTSLVRKDPTPPLSKSSRPSELEPIEGQKVLPPDEGFSWANENYNTVQRTIDVWSSVISLRVRILLDDAKWTYIGGFTEEKQVGSYHFLV